MAEEMKELEARIVAMVLGEASDFEEAELLRRIENDAQLEAFYLEMIDVHGAIGLATDPVLEEDWKLSDARRKLVLGSFESEEQVLVQKGSSSGSPWIRALAPVAAVFVLVGGLATLSYGPVMKQVKTSESVRPPEIVSYYATVEEANALQNREIVNEVRTPAAPSQQMSRVIATNSAPSLSIPEVQVGDLEFGEGDYIGQDTNASSWGGTGSAGAGSAGLGSSDTSYLAFKKAKQDHSVYSSSNLMPTEVAKRELSSGSGSADGYSDDPFADPVDSDRESPPVSSSSSASHPSTREGYDAFAVDEVAEPQIRINDSVLKGQLVEAQTQSLQFSESGQRVLLKGSMGSLRSSEVKDLEVESIPSEEIRKSLYRAEGYGNLGQFDEAEAEYKKLLGSDRYNKVARRGLERVAQIKNDYYRAAYDQTRAELLTEVDKAWELSVAPRVEFTTEKEDEVSSTNALVQREVARRATNVRAADELLLAGRKKYAEGAYVEAVEVYKQSLAALPNGPAVEDRRLAILEHLKDGLFAILKHSPQKDGYIKVQKLLEGVDEEVRTSLRLKQLIEALEAQTDEKEEKDAEQQNHSTFSLNVSDASFQVARAAMLERGEWPDAESVRTEEFVNAFDYGDPVPTMAQKVACAQDQVVHPFLQQRNLLRVSMSTAALGRKSPLQLVILLDNSGSMERPDRKAIVAEALQTLAEQLGPNDRVSLMSFSRETRLLADQWSGARAAELVDLAKNRASEGGTNLEQAIVTGAKHLEQAKLEGVQSRVVVFTDGAANLGDADPESLRAIIEGLRAKGLAFDACGIGSEGLDDGILEALTRKGDGRYYVLDSVEDAADRFAKQIAGALHPAAKNVKVQLVFNPQRVGKYKLLGFEKHRLKKEDFRNDTVDAAEMAAEESGSAVYQIQTKADGEGAIGTVFVRFLDLATGQMVERSWAIPYLENPATLEDAEPAMQLAAVACLLGEKLHKSDAGSVDFSQLKRVIGRLKYSYQDQPKVQDLIRMTEMTTR